LGAPGRRGWPPPLWLINLILGKRFRAGHYFLSRSGRTGRPTGRRGPSPRGSDQIEAALVDARAVAVGAGAADDERVAAGVEVGLPAPPANARLDGRVLDLDHFAALTAGQVFVLGVAVIVLVEHARAQFQPAQQTGVHQLGQGPIHRGPT